MTSIRKMHRIAWSRYYFQRHRTRVCHSQYQQHIILTTGSACRNFVSTSERDPGLEWTAVISHPREVPGPKGVPSRAEQLHRLSQTTASSTSSSSSDQKEFDLIVVGGGATGAGIALDAAVRGLSVACIERGDFASETSSRSTKLIWAGIRYMATATSILLSRQLVYQPWTTMQDFWGEMKMVYQCHQERRYMVEKQSHLCHWIPIAIPFTNWHVHPPPFGHALFGFFPILAPLVLKLYDSLSYFSCPPSYVMTPNQTKKTFPQLENQSIKYCSVFYEAQHNDARTNIAIAMSAAEHGATIVNYVEMIDTIQREEHDGSNKVEGIVAVDRMTGSRLDIKGKQVVFAGGPFTDGLRAMEQSSQSNDDDEDSKSSINTMQPAVRGASGTHLVLPGYFTPGNMGLLDYNTSDGRFLFILPWENHTVIGTTDTKGPAVTSPRPTDDEVEWILNETKTYLSRDLKVRRDDVLSAWTGWRPLAADPHAPPGAPASRDHVISENPETGVIFIAGGKWTTWREMAQEVVDRIVGDRGPKCSTLELKLFGGEGYTETLPMQLIQKYGIPENVAEHLSRAYGGRAWEVLCDPSLETSQIHSELTLPIVEGYPYIVAEVVWASREYACTIEDVLSRRTRLAFLNQEAALQAVNKVAGIMAIELGWSPSTKEAQILAANQYLTAYDGRVETSLDTKMKSATYERLKDVFDAMNTDENDFLDKSEVEAVAKALGFPLSTEEIDTAFREMDHDLDGKVGFVAFESWWKQSHNSPFRKMLSEELGLMMLSRDGMKSLGGGTLFG